ncbi:hypothetical protein UPYG_G00056320 [Umbra pygmaea]|uniref:LITAF domain-containing protein n=1 Tax=Umbra pygmaea TaxID=75934 RepID=A0ABD0XQA8_UMBPY
MDTLSYDEQPPTYTEATFYPQSPPPTYGEAVTIQPDPFPILALPTLEQPNEQQTGVFFHQSTHIGSSVGAQQTNTHHEPVILQGNAPCVIECTNCHQPITTVVTYKSGSTAWTMCLVFTLIGFICGCCLIPFMMQDCKDAHHRCPNCHTHLYTHVR